MGHDHATLHDHPDRPVPGPMNGERSARVLVAEDDAIIRLDLRTLLEASGLELCGEARDGLEAVELALSLEPDLVVMDVRMPGLDGIDAAMRILERRSVPIVMLTGSAGTTWSSGRSTRGCSPS